MLGYIFCDLLQHDYIAPWVRRLPRNVMKLSCPGFRDRSGSKDGTKNIKNTTHYCPLSSALRHKWTGLTRKQTKELNPAIVFTILGPYFVSCHFERLRKFIGCGSIMGVPSETPRASARRCKPIIRVGSHCCVLARKSRSE